MSGVILCHDLGSECACCGGWVGHEPIPSPRGTALRYCSTECFDSWEDFLDQQDRERSAAWCPTCGYDRHEHAPDCTDWLAHQRERADKPRLYAEVVTPSRTDKRPHPDVMGTSAQKGTPDLATPGSDNAAGVVGTTGPTS